MVATNGERRRHWADVVAIVAAVYSFLAAVWLPPEVFTGGDAAEVRSTSWLTIAYAAGGVLGVAGLIVAQKWTLPGRLMIGAGGLIVLSGFFALSAFTALATVSLGLTGLALAGAASFVGRMPAAAS